MTLTYIRRKLALEHPAEYNFELSRDRSLHNLGVSLSNMNRHKAALIAMVESVEITHGLVAQRPVVFARYLAESLNALSTVQSQVGSHQEALMSSLEAVGIYQQLTEDRPVIFKEELAFASE